MCANAKTKLLFQLSVWLLQLHDWNFMNVVLENIHAVGADT